MKDIIPRKLFIEINPDGSIADKRLLYNLSDNGSFSPFFNSVAVTLDSDKVSSIVSEAINSAKTSEGI